MAINMRANRVLIGDEILVPDVLPPLVTSHIVSEILVSGDDITFKAPGFELTTSANNLVTISPNGKEGLR